GWTYQVSNAATQYLAAGQTATEKFTGTDKHSPNLHTRDQLVTVTITDTNDAPTITVAGTDADGAVTEDATTPNLSDTGTIAFNDVDLTDAHTTSVTAAATITFYGTLTIGALNSFPTRRSSDLGWTYQVSNAATQYLAAGQTATEKFT